MPEVSPYPPWRSSRTISPSTQLDHAPLHLVDEAGLVRGHDDRRAARVDAGQQLHDVDGCRGVEVSGRLVGQQHLGAVDQRARDRDALLLTAGELVREPLLLAGEADEREHLGHGLLDESARRSDDLQGERDVLEDGLVRQQPEVLEDRADVPAEVRHLAVGQRAQIAAEHDDAAVARRLLAQDESQARGLARARGADEEHELAAEHLEVHVAQGGPRCAAKALRDVLEPDHGHPSLSGQAPCTPNDTRASASARRPFPVETRASRRRTAAVDTAVLPRVRSPSGSASRRHGPVCAAPLVMVSRRISWHLFPISSCAGLVLS